MSSAGTIADSESRDSMGFESRAEGDRRKAWSIVGVILYLGRPASPLEVAELSPAEITADDVAELSALQASPFRLNEQGHVELVKEQVKSRCDVCGRASKAKASSLQKKMGLQDADKENVASRPRATVIPRGGTGFLKRTSTAAATKAATEERYNCTLPTLPVFSRYVVESEGSAGGYGTVYRVRRKTDGQIFAMKCPLDKTLDCYVKNEIDMLHKFRGKNYIVQCESVVHDEKMRANIVMQYFTHDRPEVLKKEITVAQLRSFAFCLFKALTCLHDQGVVHRDIKPSNFLFCRETNVGCLVDFNLALDLPRLGLTRKPLRSLGRTGHKPLKRKRQDDNAAHLPEEPGCSTSRAVCAEDTGAGQPVTQASTNLPPPVRKQPRPGPFAGTKGYRAPEVLLRSQNQSTKVDIWSAGVTLVNLIAGRNIFPSSTSEQALRDIAKVRGVEQVVALAQEHGRPVPEDIAEVRCRGNSLEQVCMRITRKSDDEMQQWPPAVFDLLEKCLQIDPQKRIDADMALQHEFFNA